MCSVLNSSDSHNLWYFCLGSVHLSNCFAEPSRHTHCSLHTFTHWTLLHTAHCTMHNARCTLHTAHFAPEINKCRCKRLVDDVVHWIFIKFVREQIITCSKLLTPPRHEWWANMDFSVSFWYRNIVCTKTSASARTEGTVQSDRYML